MKDLAEIHTVHSFALLGIRNGKKTLLSNFNFFKKLPRKCRGLGHVVGELEAEEEVLRLPFLHEVAPQLLRG